MKNVLISGGSGFVGRHLSAYLNETGYKVKTLSRKAEGVDTIQWDPADGILPESALEDVDIIINLAGAGIADKRWTKNRKAVLRNSRLDSTRTLVQAIGQSAHKPSVLISMSGVNYYPEGNSPKTEDDPPGTSFLSELCKEWESEAIKASEFGVRTVILRLGVVLDASGGALQKMLPPFRFGLGGPIGTGSQGFPWISMRDLLHVIQFIIEKETVEGPVNAVHPDKVDQKSFARALGMALNRPAVLPLPAFMVRLLFGQMGREMLLADMKVAPGKLMNHQYIFQEDSVENFLHSLFSRE